MADTKIEIKKTIEFKPMITTSIVEAGELEKGLNDTLRPIVEGYKGCKLIVKLIDTPAGKAQNLKFIVFIDKFSKSVDRSTNPKMSYILGRTSSILLKDNVKDALLNFVFEDQVLNIGERKNTITVELNFIKCLQQIMKDNADYRVEYSHVGYDKTFNGEIKKYIFLVRVEDAMRKELEVIYDKKEKEGKNTIYSLLTDEDDEDDDYTRA